MKKVFIALVFLGLQVYLHAAIIRWDGGGGINQSWINPLNWEGDQLPTPADDVVLDNYFVLDFYYQVNLPGGDTKIEINTLTISPSPNCDIYVVLPQDNTAPVGLRLIKLDTSFIIEAGGWFQNSSSAINSATISLSVGAWMRISNGGHYIHNSPSGHQALVQKLVVDPSTMNGEFMFNVGIQPYEISPGSYGNLTISASAAGTYEITDPGDFHVYGDLVIEGAELAIQSVADFHFHQSVTVAEFGKLFFLNTSGIQVDGDITLKDFSQFTLAMASPFVANGNFLQLANSVADLQAANFNNSVFVHGDFISSGTITSTGSGNPKLVFAGAAAQNLGMVSPGGTISGQVTVTVNNAAGLNLLTPVSLPHKLEFVAGRLVTNGTNLLAMEEGAVWTGASTTSFVEGPMKKIGNEDFVFPIGKGGIYAPIGLRDAGGGSTSDDEFVAEYIRDNPQSAPAYGGTMSSGLNHVSYVEYWTIEQTVGSSSRNISVDVHPESFCRRMDSTYICRWNGSLWSKLQTAIDDGPNSMGLFQTGTLVSTDNPTGFSSTQNAVTLSTTLLYLINPLPLNLVSFEAMRISSTRADLAWRLAECCPAASRFEVQRAGADRVFETLASVNGNERSRDYLYADQGLKNGLNYYRLRMIDPDGSVNYSRTVAVMNGIDGIAFVSVIPSVVTGGSVLSVAASRAQTVTIVVSDMSGREVFRQRHQVPRGNSNLQLDLSRLPAGTYHLFGLTDEGRTGVLRFVRL